MAASKFDQSVNNAKQKAQKKLNKPSKDCEDLFDAIGVSSRDVASMMDSMTFEDGTKSKARISDVMGGPVAGMEDWTVGDLFLYGTPPLPSTTRIDGFSPPGGTIYLRPSGVNWQNLVHETLHQYDPLGSFSDGRIMDRLAAKYGTDPSKGGIDRSGPSSRISDKIKEKCN